MKVGINILLIVLVSCFMYTYLGQLVPQKEVQAPEVIEIAEDVTTEDMINIGQEIASGKGLCLTCHQIGEAAAQRFPHLSGIGVRAETAIAGMSGVDYLAQSLYEPDVYIVPGYTSGMPAISKPPIGLTDEEILCVIAWLQSMGGEPSVTLQTAHAYYAPEEEG